MAVARNVWGFIERRDHRVMRRMNRWRAPRWVRYWMITATRLVVPRVTPKRQSKLRRLIITHS